MAAKRAALFSPVKHRADKAKSKRRPAANSLAQMAEHEDSKECPQIQHKRSNPRPFLESRLQCGPLESFSFEDGFENFSLQICCEETKSPESDDTSTRKEQSNQGSITQFRIPQKFRIRTELPGNAFGRGDRLPLSALAARERRSERADDVRRVPASHPRADGLRGLGSPASS